MFCLLSKWLFDTFCINEFFINLEAEDRETIKLFSDLGFQTNPNKNPSNLDGTKINYIYNKKLTLHKDDTCWSFNKSTRDILFFGCCTKWVE